jgi:hypothetical protein
VTRRETNFSRANLRLEVLVMAVAGASHVPLRWYVLHVCMIKTTVTVTLTEVLNTRGAFEIDSRLTIADLYAICRAIVDCRGRQRVQSGTPRRLHISSLRELALILDTTVVPLATKQRRVVRSNGNHQTRSACSENVVVLAGAVNDSVLESRSLSCDILDTIRAEMGVTQRRNLPCWRAERIVPSNDVDSPNQVQACQRSFRSPFSAVGSVPCPPWRPPAAGT